MSKQKKTRQVIKVNTLDPMAASYIAGFADGDGSFVVQAVRHKDYVLGWQIRTSFLFIQKNIRMDSLERIKEEIGMGTLRTEKGTEQVGEYSLVGGDALELFLPQIIPHLRIKKTQATLMLQLIEKLRVMKGTHDQVLFFEALDMMDQISSLNDSKLTKRTNTGAYVKANMPSQKMSPTGVLSTVTNSPLDLQEN